MTISLWFQENTIQVTVESYLNVNLCSQGDLTKVRLYMGDHLIQIGGYITGVSIKGAIVVNLKNGKIKRNTTST